ncbi:MAG: winged helix-turn-helix domain-containing protein [Candidatus Eremiobacteraeota bacterium]|nr:winged helix-turn-helix domain-containing protein [Candidatus Eremiobacteraeota bacterium]
MERAMSVYEFGPFVLDAERLLLLDRGQPMPLGPKVVETMLALVEHPGEVLTKSALLDRIWPEGYVDEANLAQNVYVLRKTLRARWETDAIETIPRRGYRFTARVVRRDDVPLAQPKSSAAAAERKRRPLWGFAAAASFAVTLAAALGAGVFSSHGSPAQTALSPDGGRLYEIGRYYWNLRTPGGITKSLQYFARVIDTDPRNARGYAALASANAIMGDYGYGTATPKVYYARAKAYAQKALAIDSSSGEAYAVLGMIASTKYASTSDMAGALVKLQRAVALDPSSGPAHEWYGVALIEHGQFNEAYGQLRVAAELDPLSVATTAWLGDAAYLEHRYDDAIAYARETLDLSPERHEAYQTMGMSYEALGNRERALDAYRHLASECADCRAQAAALMAGLYARSNRIGDARAQLAIAQAAPKKVSPDDLAVALAAIGQRGVALSLLRRAGSGEYVKAEMQSDPRFAVLRSDTRVARHAGNAGT